jgi:biotin carboxyl carrier protein
VILDAVVLGRTLRVEVREKDGHYAVVIDGKAHDVDYQETGRDFVSLLLDGRSYEAGLERRPSGCIVHFPADTLDVELSEAARGAAALARKPAGPARVVAPMPGKIVRVLVVPGQEVPAGQGLVVMEAMKMENELRSPRPGSVQQVAVREGQTVETGALLAVVS